MFTRLKTSKSERQVPGDRKYPPPEVNSPENVHKVSTIPYYWEGRRWVGGEKVRLNPRQLQNSTSRLTRCFLRKTGKGEKLTPIGIWAGPHIGCTFLLTPGGTEVWIKARTCIMHMCQSKGEVFWGRRGLQFLNIAHNNNLQCTGERLRRRGLCTHKGSALISSSGAILFLHMCKDHPALTPIT